MEHEAIIELLAGVNNAKDAMEVQERRAADLTNDGIKTKLKTCRYLLEDVLSSLHAELIECEESHA